MINKIIECKAEHMKKNGKRKTENRGLIQRYKCLDCSKRFTLDDGFFRMRNAPQKITQAIDLFYRGASTRGTQEHLGMFYPHNADHSTILRWVWKYAKIIGKFTDKRCYQPRGEAESLQGVVRLEGASSEWHNFQGGGRQCDL